MDPCEPMVRGRHRDHTVNARSVPRGFPVVAAGEARHEVRQVFMAGSDVATHLHFSGPVDAGHHLLLNALFAHHTQEVRGQMFIERAMYAHDEHLG